MTPSLFSWTVNNENVKASSLRIWSNAGKNVHEDAWRLYIGARSDPT